MSDRVDIARRFLELHASEHPLLLPNPWDLGSARLLASLGFKALATTSGGFAASLGRLDGNVSREEAVAHASAVGEATGLPVNGDFENGFAHHPAGVAETVTLALEAGVAGCSVEDWSGDEIYDIGLAAERVVAAAEAAHAGPVPMVLTARAENHAHGRHDLEDTIARLIAYEEAGADVLFAPRLRGIELNIRAASVGHTGPTPAIEDGPGWSCVAGAVKATARPMSGPLSARPSPPRRAVAAIVRGVGSDEAVCSAIVNWGANPVGTRVLRLRQTLAAGGSQDGIVSQMPAVVDGSTTQNAVRLVRLQPGDRVELLGFQTSGFTIEVFPLDFGAAWIGP